MSRLFIWFVYFRLDDVYKVKAVFRFVFWVGSVVLCCTSFMAKLDWYVLLEFKTLMAVSDIYCNVVMNFDEDNDTAANGMKRNLLT